MEVTTTIAAPAPTAVELIPTPYTVVIDTREQRPFSFTAPLRIARQRRTFAVQTTVATLTSGDYSLVGFETRVAVERKSVADLFSTLSAGRARFERELDRLNSTYERAAIVIEEEWSKIFLEPPKRSQLPPRTVFMSVVSFQEKYPRVHWWTLPGRACAEACTIRILDKFWREHQ